jgi:hypothetical protein
VLPDVELSLSQGTLPAAQPVDVDTGRFQDRSKAAVLEMAREAVVVALAGWVDASEPGATDMAVAPSALKYAGQRTEP